MRKLAIAAGTGAVLVLLTSAPAFAGSAPRVRHVGNTVDVTRSGKSVTISAEYRCSGVAMGRPKEASNSRGRRYC